MRADTPDGSSRIGTPSVTGTFPVKGSLSEAFVTHAGNVSDKWEQFLPIYDFVLANILTRGNPIQLLEIGVQNGGSLEVWSKVLPLGSTILGFDIDEACRSLILPDNVTVKILDANNAAALDGALDGLTFDLIVDDGSHISEHIIATFRHCFDRLKPGGFYVVEDLHASYRASHGGGFRKADAAIEYFKTLVDAVNSDHFEADAADQLAPDAIGSLKDLGEQIAWVAFFDSVFVVQKLAIPKHQPFRRLFTGQRTPVFDIASSLSLLPVEQLRHLLLCDSAFANFAPRLFRQLADLSESLGRANARMAQLDLQATNLSEQLTAAHAAHAQQTATWEQKLLSAEDRANAYSQLAETWQQRLRLAEDRAIANEAVLNHIYSSTIWKALRLLVRVAQIIPASIRSKMKGF